MDSYLARYNIFLVRAGYFKNVFLLSPNIWLESARVGKIPARPMPKITALLIIYKNHILRALCHEVIKFVHLYTLHALKVKYSTMLFLTTHCTIIFHFSMPLPWKSPIDFAES